MTRDNKVASGDGIEWDLLGQKNLADFIYDDYVRLDALEHLLRDMSLAADEADGDRILISSQALFGLAETVGSANDRIYNTLDSIHQHLLKLKMVSYPGCEPPPGARKRQEARGDSHHE
jgi:hypothetical protein